MYRDINKILVVDDNEILLRSIERHLHRQGFQVAVALDGGMAQDILCRAAQEKCPFEVVISDIHMPILDGLSFIPWLHRRFPDCPVLVISGFGNQDEIKSLLRPDLDFFYKKPVLPEDIMSFIQKINIRHLEQALTSYDAGPASSR